ncbi:MAG: Ig-like domain-containing protein, partial [Planctomycetota bacterium]
MATRFLRVDLSDNARDFRPIAVEPGVPLLDRSNATARILLRWLGGLTADPEWEGESVNFYVRDDQGGRLEEAVCLPASEEDLQGPLRQDLQTVKDRLAAAKPANTTERAVQRIVSDTFAAVVENEHRTDRENYFFKYRDVLGRWRLVWCWGYQRVDLEPAPSVICTDATCGLLFVRRPGQSPKCPACEAAIQTGQKKRKRRSPKRAILACLLLLLLIGGLVAYWLFQRNRLIATPDAWTGGVGSRVEFRVEKGGLFGATDVSREAVAVVADPRVARLDRFGSSAMALNPGKTLVHFYLGDRSTTATLIVTAEKNPSKIRIEPELVELGIGTTARLKLIGQYDDGTTADLTLAGDWEPANDGVVFAHDGFLEGLSVGTSTVRARYRATPDDEYLKASANVSVAKVDFKSLEMAVAPDPVPVGRASALRIDALSESGKRYSVLESSRLGLDIDPSYVATALGTHVAGLAPGRGTMKATFDGRLTGNLQFNVAWGAQLESLVVMPERLEMIVGEITDLSIAAPSGNPIRIASDDRKVVDVTRDSRLIGRSVGSTKVVVSQAGQQRTVEVKVAKADVASIAVEPPRVVVPVDHRQAVRVTGRIKDGRRVEMAPEVLACEKTPSPRYADFDAPSMEILGRWPTAKTSPQSLAFRFRKLQAAAPVEVVVAPLRLELTPAGNVGLPLGQMMAVDAWANYRAGYRVQVAGGRVDWHGDPAKGKTPGLELRGNKVAALEEGVGPLAVWGTYFGNDSPRTTFKSVAAEPVELKLDVDRTLRLANEPGRMYLLGTGPRGDVELVPELASFKSSDENVLTVDAVTGAFHCGRPGECVVTAAHPASAKPATLKLRVVDPANARLAFEPRSVKMAVDQIARLDLFLEAKAGDEVERARMVGPGVSYSIEQPDAVRWHPPTITALSAADPFEVTASYLPYLLRPATAKVEIVEAQESPAVSVRPASPRVAPGQAISLAVESPLPDSKEWTEVRPDAVSWEQPSNLIWEPASRSLRPAVGAPVGFGDDAFVLTAKLRGAEEERRITLSEPTLDAADPAVRLVVEREPPGRYLPVDAQQRYSIWLEKGDTREPATDVQWLSGFSNDYVGWKAPVLTARRAGYEQWLRAKAGGRTVRWRAHTIDPFQPGQMPPLREDQPIEVVILSDQGPAVQFPVGARFDDFRIEARYADGFTQLVTRKATMSTDEGFGGGPVSFSGGRMIGVKPGQTAVHADFDGVPTKKGLAVSVTPNVDLDEIRVKPSPVSILPRETITMEAEGLKAGKSIGLITGLGGLSWQSSDARVARVDGPAVTGVNLGLGQVTARHGSVTSKPADVAVVDSIADALVAEPNAIQIRVGQSVALGRDLAVRRAETDFSRRCDVTPALASVVRYVPETHSLVGVSPGVSGVTFAWADKLTSTTVHVLPTGVLEGHVIVEPAATILSPGQAQPMRVFLITKTGQRIDRTNSAILTSSSPSSVTIRGTRVCGVAPGTAEITATLPETKTPGKATVSVDGEPITDVTVDPSQLALSVGDVARLRVLGTSASGTHELFPQPNLEVTAGGTNPQAVRVVSSEHVEAVAPGSADLTVRWRPGNLTRHIPVTVTDDPLADLAIHPAGATIHPGQAVVYQVTGMRGGRRRVLGPEDGASLFVGDPQVARVVDNMVVRGEGLGQSTVVAQVGPKRAEAVLSVVPGTGPGSVAYHVPGGSGREVIYGSGGLIYGEGGVVYGPGGRVYHGGGIRVYRPGETIIRRPGIGVASLRFIPDTLRMSPDSPGSPVRVIEVLSDGSPGRDVSTDPALDFSTPGNVAVVERTPEGPVVRPVAPGETRVAAKIGDAAQSILFAQPELLVQVGDVVTGVARLEVAPNPLDLWPGEADGFRHVRVTPGPGQVPIDVSYSITVPEGAVVKPEPGGRLRGISPGLTQVGIRVKEPGTPYDGLSTTATVRVTAPDRLRIEPAEVSLRAGETTPRFMVIAEGADGVPYQVPASLESMDTNILRPDPLAPDRFVAATLGQTQVRAVYRNGEALATVAVTGERFLDVKTSLNEGANDFS